MEVAAPIYCFFNNFDFATNSPASFFTKFCQGFKREKEKKERKRKLQNESGNPLKVSTFSEEFAEIG